MVLAELAEGTIAASSHLEYESTTRSHDQAIAMGVVAEEWATSD